MGTVDDLGNGMVLRHDRQITEILGVVRDLTRHVQALEAQTLELTNWVSAINQRVVGLQTRIDRLEASNWGRSE